MQFLRLLIFCLPLLLSCGDNPPESNDQILRINLGADPLSLEPGMTTDIPSITLHRMLFDGLTRLDSHGQPRLAVAHSVDISTDGLTYTFFLRPSRWSNGDPLKAQDFEFAWKKLLDPFCPCAYADLMYPIQFAKEVKEGVLPPDRLGVEALDDYTLQVRLNHPTPYFLQLCAYSPLYPQHPDCDYGAFEHPEDLISNGPFVLRSRVFQSSLQLEKNYSYWDSQRVFLDMVELLILEARTELALFDSGKLDWAGGPISTLPPDSLPFLKKKNQLHHYPLAGTHFYRFNLENTLFSSKKLREAFALAIKKNEIVQHVLHGEEQAARTLVPPSFHLGTKVAHSHEQLLTAQRLFAEALLDLQIKREDLPPITLTYRKLWNTPQVAQAIQSQWKEVLGVDVKLLCLEQKVFQERMNEGEFQVAVGDWIADVADPIDFLQLFSQSRAWGTSWKNEEFLSLIDQAKNTANEEERSAALRKAEEILLADTPIVPIFHHSAQYAKSSDLQGVIFSPLGSPDFIEAIKAPKR